MKSSIAVIFAFDWYVRGTLQLESTFNVAAFKVFFVMLEFIFPQKINGNFTALYDV